MGMKQRLAVGCAIVHRPPVLLLDGQLLAWIDQRAPAAFMRITCVVRRARLSCTRHYMHEAEELSDRVGILSGGRLVAEGTPSAVRDSVKTQDVFRSGTAPGGCRAS
jgi:ABC-type multidrug transport system ATPase subunit